MCEGSAAPLSHSHTLTLPHSHSPTLSLPPSHPPVDVLLQNVDAKLLVIRMMVIEIAIRDQSEQLPGVIDDGQMADAAILQHAAGFIERRVRLTTDHLGGHHVLNQCLTGVETRHDDSRENVPLRDDAN